jgi:hypothetical protein
MSKVYGFLSQLDRKVIKVPENSYVIKNTRTFLNKGQEPVKALLSIPSSCVSMAT